MCRHAFFIPLHCVKGGTGGAGGVVSFNYRPRKTLFCAGSDYVKGGTGESRRSRAVAFREGGWGSFPFAYHPQNFSNFAGPDCVKGWTRSGRGSGILARMRQELPRLVRDAHNPPLLGKKGVKNHFLNGIFCDIISEKDKRGSFRYV